MQRSAGVLAVGVLSLFVASGAFAQVINACVGPTGSLRVVLPSEPCKSSEFALSWNALGPQGPAVIGTVTIGPITFSTYELSGGVSIATTTGGSGGGAGKATFSPVVVTKAVDSSFPTLLQKAASGQHLANVTITIAGTPQMQIVLSDVIISSDSFVTLAGSAALFERVAFDFAKIELIVGSSHACWDVAGSMSC